MFPLLRSLFARSKGARARPTAALEPVYDLKWLTLGRNRDEWVAHGAPHGLVPMQATGSPNR
ncbi:MAG: hypothetical protein LBV61_05860, partial [Burkholderiaceae bacterium]|nr:hypothetical protein [Burkholderiaceae bacterium]